MPSYKGWAFEVTASATSQWLQTQNPPILYKRAPMLLSQSNLTNIIIKIKNEVTMLPYIGGKSFLARWIINNFPTNYQQMQYVEVFGGGGWVLFKKEESFLETYNDLNSHLVNLFKIIRDNYSEFAQRAEWSLHSREMYLEAREKLKDDKFMSDMEKAMHYAIQKCQSFAGKGGWAYAVTSDKITNGKWLPFLNRLSVINARLKKVQIECLDFGSVIEKYDGPNTLFYFDPPYVGVEHYYNAPGVKFEMKDHHRLNDYCRNLQGKFSMSYYENPVVRDLYKSFNVITKNTVKHSAGTTRQKKTPGKPKSVELLITNY